MSTNFPTSLDTNTELPVETASNPLSTNHVINHTNTRDAIKALEAKVGINSSGDNTSIDYKLSGVTGSDKAVSKTGTETLTNKTLTAPVITSPKITVGSDAVGDLHYTSNVDGTQSRLGKGNDNQILKMNGTALNWEDETVTNNASTTVAGIVEVATSAEVTAGTATGGTGAVLAVTPDALAASTPVFNGGGLTRVSRLIAQSATTLTQSIANTNENTLLTVSIPANTLGTANAVRVILRGYKVNQNGTVTSTYNFKYGSTIVSTFNLTDLNESKNYQFRCEFILHATGSTSSQSGVVQFFATPVSNGATLTGYTSTASGSATEVSTGALNFVLTTQLSSTSNAGYLVIQDYVIEQLA